MVSPDSKHLAGSGCLEVNFMITSTTDKVCKETFTHWSELCVAVFPTHRLYFGGPHKYIWPTIILICPNNPIRNQLTR